MRIYSYPGNPRVTKILIVASICNIDVETPDFKFPDELPKLEKLNPFKKVPTLEVDTYGGLGESLAIMKYVARLAPAANLLGKNVWDQALVEQWLWVEENELMNHLTNIITMIMGFQKFDKQIKSKAMGGMRKFLATLNGVLKNNTYLATNYLTVADISMALAIGTSFGIFVDPKWRKQIPNVVRWVKLVTEQPEFKKHQKIVYCDKPMKEKK